MALDQLLDPQCKYLLYGGAMAGGKSYLLRWASLYYSLWLSLEFGVRDVAVGLFSEDYPTLKDRQISKIVREFPPFLGELKESKEEGFAFFIAPEYGGGRILLRNLDDPSKYMSSEFAGIFLEESTRNPEQTFQDLRNRLRWKGVDQVKFMGATNPGGIGHGWNRKLFVEKNNEDPERDRFFYVHANAYDNKYISPDYIKQLESLPDAKRKAFLDGSWDVFEGQIFTEFNRNIHVCTPFQPRQGITLIGGLDWGYSAPAVLLLGAFLQKKLADGRTFNRLYIYKEVDGSGKTPREWAETYKQIPMIEQHKIWADPAMFNKLQDSSFSLSDQFKREGIYIYKSTNNALNKITNIHNWLSLAPDGEPYMIITENCRNLIRTLPEAMYDDLDPEDKDRNWSEDHWYDSLSYMLAMVKWIDAKSGGYISGKYDMDKRKPYTEAGEIKEIDPDSWGRPESSVYYKS